MDVKLRHYDVFYYRLVAESHLDLTLRRVWSSVYACSVENDGLVPNIGIVSSVLGLKPSTVLRCYKDLEELGLINDEKVLGRIEGKSFVWMKIGMGDACELMYSLFWGLSVRGSRLVKMPMERLVTFYGARVLKGVRDIELKGEIVDEKYRIETCRVRPVLRKLKKKGLIEYDGEIYQVNAYEVIH